MTREKLFKLVTRYKVHDIDYHEELLAHLAYLATYYKDGEVVPLEKLVKELAWHFSAINSLSEACAEQLVLFGNIGRAGWTRVDHTNFKIERNKIANNLPEMSDRRPRFTWTDWKKKPTTSTPVPEPHIRKQRPTLRNRIARRLRGLADLIEAP